MRTAALLDLENLLAHVVYEADGGALRLWTDAELWVAATALLRMLDEADVRWAVAVVNPTMARSLVGHPLCDRVRIHTHRGGPDAADRALALRARAIPRRLRHVLVGTGDHGFVPVVDELHGRGHLVTVVSLAASLSRRLAAVADRTVVLAA